MKKRRGLAALLAAAMCLSAIVTVYADEIAAEPYVDVDVVTETGDVTEDVTDESDDIDGDVQEAKPVTEEESPDVMDEEPVEEVVAEVSDAEPDAGEETVEEPALDTDEAVYDADIVASGECGANGDNVKWALYSDGLLDIKGTGEMHSYGNRRGYQSPWRDHWREINRITISDGITVIGRWAFFNCYNAKTIALPDSLSKILEGAFHQCESIEAITIPANVSYIHPGDVFSFDSSLKCIYVDSQNESYISIDGVLYTKDLTSLVSFPGGNTMKTYSILEGTKYILSDAFEDAQYLETVYFPSSVREIGESAFFSSNIQEVYFNNGLVSIGDFSFYCCTHLRSVSLPETVISVGHDAFGCDAIEYIYISSSVETIGESAFMSDGLKTIEISPDNQYFTVKDNILYSKDLTELWLYPSGIENTKFYIPLGIKTIKERAICSEYLQEIFIPGSVIEMEDFSIIGESIRKITINGDARNIAVHEEYKTMNIAESDLHIHIPNGTNISDYFKIKGLPEDEQYYHILSEDGHCSDPDCPMGLYKKPEKAYYLKITSDNIQNSGNDRIIAMRLGSDDVDRAFDTNSTIYNYELSKLSSIVAMSAYRKDDVAFNLDVLGFENIDTVGSYEKLKEMTERDSHYVAYTFGKKEIEIGNDKYTTIAVVIKGTSGNKEWYSNFDAWKDKNSPQSYHYGFSIAGDRLLLSLNSYIKSNGIDTNNNHIKFWITGHSRGAGVGNYVAGKLTQSEKYIKENIYAYLYAVPAITNDKSIIDDTSYQNIYNFINPQDFVPRMPLSKWGYGRYGRDLVFPNELTRDDYNIYKEKFEEYFKSFFYVDPIYFAEGSATTERLCEIVYKSCPSVYDYYFKNQSANFTWYDYFHDGISTIIAGNSTFEKIFGGGGMLAYFELAGYNFVNQYFTIGSKVNKTVTFSHTPETYIAWAYTCEDLSCFSHSNFRKYSICCPVDVEVYDQDNYIVGKVSSNTVDESVTVIDIIVDSETSQKYIYYPAGKTLTIKAIGYDNGNMDFNSQIVSIRDYSCTYEHSVENIEITPNTVVTVEQKELSPYSTSDVDTVLTAVTTENGSVRTVTYKVHTDNTVDVDEKTLYKAPAKPTTVIKTAFGGRTVQLNCDDTDAEIYYQFGSSNITTACEHVKAGETIYLDEPMTGTRAAMYFKAYKNGKWSVLGKWGVLNVQIAQPLLKLRGNKYKGNFFIYTQTKNSYIVYTLDGTIPSIEEGTQKLKVKNGRLIWGTQGNINVPYGCTVKAIAIRCGLVTSDVMTYTNR